MIFSELIADIRKLTSDKYVIVKRTSTGGEYYDKDAMGYTIYSSLATVYKRSEIPEDIPIFYLLDVWETKHEIFAVPIETLFILGREKFYEKCRKN